MIPTTSTDPQPTETILVVNRKDLENVLPFFSADGVNASSGLYATDAGQLGELRDLGYLAPRTDLLERDSTRKQLIVYALVQHAGKILCYKRGKVGAEARLHAKYSIGVGGHINDKDWDVTGAAVFDVALQRELAEEVGILPEHILSYELLGLVNEDVSSVGQVHLGLVYLVDLKSLDGLSFEEALVDPRWLTPSEMQAHADEGFLELWSELVVDDLLAQGRALAEPLPLSEIRLERVARIPVPVKTASKLPPHQVRVIEEKAELDSRRGKLRAFTRDSPAFAELPHEDQSLMYEQERIMYNLSEVLGKRIALF